MDWLLDERRDTLPNKHSEQIHFSDHYKLPSKAMLLSNSSILETPPVTHSLDIWSNQSAILTEDVKFRTTKVELGVALNHMTAEGKNSISQLQEQCTARGWGAPTYNLVHEEGPPHMKRFQFEVKVNYEKFKPEGTMATKKGAKAAAAAKALTDLNL